MTDRPEKGTLEWAGQIARDSWPLDEPADLLAAVRGAVESGTIEGLAQGMMCTTHWALSTDECPLSGLFLTSGCLRLPSGPGHSAG